MKKSKQIFILLTIVTGTVFVSGSASARAHRPEPDRFHRCNGHVHYCNGRLHHIKNLRRALLHDYVESFQFVLPWPTLREKLSDLTEKQAYRFQALYTKALLKAGETLSGYKLGFTTDGPLPFGAPGPVYGRLFESLEFPNGGTASISENFIMGAQGIELALRFAKNAHFKPKDFPLSDEEILSLIDAVAPVIENPDVGFTNQMLADYRDIIAANGVSRFYVLGDFTPIDELEGDIDDISVTVFKDGELVLEGDAGMALDGQLSAVEFLLKGLSEEGRGAKVRKGQFLTTGSLGGDLGLEPGTFVADFGQLGEVSFTFTE